MNYANDMNYPPLTWHKHSIMGRFACAWIATVRDGFEQLCGRKQLVSSKVYHNGVIYATKPIVNGKLNNQLIELWQKTKQ